jgi:hypothetical protein
MSGCHYHNFDITIVGERPPYPVSATYRGLRATGVFAQDHSLPLWQEHLALLTDPRHPPQQEHLIEVGTLLFEELMRDELRELWVQARADLDNAGASGLRIRLHIDPPGVAALPWESLYDRRRQQPFGADASIALVRVANQIGYVGRARSLESALPLKILIAAVDDPDGVGAGINTRQELATVEAILAPLRPHKIDLQIISGRLDIHTLRRHLVEHQPDIFHLISHGEPDCLLLWNREGEPALVTGSQIQAALRQVDSLKLVFLNACLAGRPDGKVPFAGVAHRLLQANLPAVIAMQFEIMDHVAIEFAAFLYEALVTGDCPGAVDRAVGVARTNLYISDPGHIGYMTPILWLNGEDGLIAHFRPETAAQDAPEDRAATAGGANVFIEAPPVIDLHLFEKEQWFSALPATIPDTALRFLYTDKRRDLGDLLTLLQKDQATMAAGLPLDVKRVKDRVSTFDEQRRNLDELLISLKSPPA